MRILILERETEGMHTDLPSFVIFDDTNCETKMTFTSDQLNLIRTACVFKSIVHRGAHSGCVADWIYYKYPEHMTHIDHSLVDKTKLELEKQKADYVFETMAFSYDSDLLFEELDEYIEYVIEVANGTREIKKHKWDDIITNHNDLIPFWCNVTDWQTQLDFGIELVQNADMDESDDSDK